MIQGRSKTCSRSTASRRARLAIFVLSAVLSSSVLAAPTIRPRALALSFSEPDPAPTQTSSGPGSLPGGGRGDWDLERVDYSPVIFRQDVDGLQAFDDPEYAKEIHDGDLHLSASAKFHPRVDLSRRGCCASTRRPGSSGSGDSNAHLGAAESGSTRGSASSSSGTESSGEQEIAVPYPPSSSESQSTEIDQTPSRSRSSEDSDSDLSLSNNGIYASGDRDEIIKNLQTKLRSNAKKYEQIRSRVSMAQKMKGEERIDACRKIEKENDLDNTQSMSGTAMTATHYGIDVVLDGGVSDEQYSQLFLDVRELLAEMFRPQSSQSDAGVVASPAKIP
ncbi:hypothetical protein EV360DRAFT_70081 [Lentinula raphanica]|nr:hypothetical protein EV360DRAFT_70081 [Lentinula raphanica]